MKLDFKLLTGLLLGVVLGLQYHESLLLYMPLFVIAGLALLLTRYI